MCSQRQNRLCAGGERNSCAFVQKLHSNCFPFCRYSGKTQTTQTCNASLSPSASCYRSRLGVAVCKLYTDRTWFSINTVLVLNNLYAQRPSGCGSSSPKARATRCMSVWSVFIQMMLSANCKYYLLYQYQKYLLKLPTSYLIFPSILFNLTNTLNTHHTQYNTTITSRKPLS